MQIAVNEHIIPAVSKQDAWLGLQLGLVGEPGCDRRRGSSFDWQRG
jgi:hypothetical protein